MVTGELRNQADPIWNAFWTVGISNPLEVMEQITYLPFLRRLDDRPALASIDLPASQRFHPISQRPVRHRAVDRILSSNPPEPRSGAAAPPSLLAWCPPTIRGQWTWTLAPP